MDETTRRSLIELNRRFYSHFAASFSSSRERPWTGWSRVLRYLPDPCGKSLRVLDVGCGNGRFASFLVAHDIGLDYLGVDGSAELLKIARERLAEAVTTHGLEATWESVELGSAELRERLGKAVFDLVVAFGVLHHVPGRSHRAALIAELASRVAAGGLLVVSFWRFDRLPRLTAKLVSWADYNSTAAMPVDATEMESGDYLLTWAGDRNVPRYCHLVDDDEISELSASCGLPETVRFTADGPGGQDNVYLVLQKPGQRPC